MKKRDENIEAEICKTLRLLDEVPCFETSHRFRAQLMQRIETEITDKQKKRAFGWRPDYRLALAVLLVAINFSSVVLLFQPGNEQSKATATNISYGQGDDYTQQELAYYDQTAAYEKTQIP